jgi:MtN3 and saliva related transmembrane protein
MQIFEIAGYIGTFLSSITFLPQVIQVHKTQSAKDLSMQMLLIVFCSCIVWLVYGFGAKAMPVIICNFIILALSAWLIWFKWSKEKK